jgi:hypothetical protein
MDGRSLDIKNGGSKQLSAKPTHSDSSNDSQLGILLDAQRSRLAVPAAVRRVHERAVNRESWDKFCPQASVLRRHRVYTDGSKYPSQENIYVAFVRSG